MCKKNDQNSDWKKSYRKYSRQRGRVVRSAMIKGERNSHGHGSKPAPPFFCVLGKDNLQHFPLLEGLNKQL